MARVPIPICSPRLSMAETGAVVAATSSTRNSALLKPCEPMAADGVRRFLSHPVPRYRF